MVVAFVLLDVIVILVVARGLGALAGKLRQPKVVGHIVAGVLLGPTLLGRAVFAWDHPWSFLPCRSALAGTAPVRMPSITSCLFPPEAQLVLGVIGEIALVLFMFLVGFELDWNLLKGRRRGITTLAFGVVGTSIALGFLVGPLLYDERFVAAFGTPVQPSETRFALTVGAMLSATALPVTARILQEKGLAQSSIGSIGVASSAVVTVLLFLVLAVQTGMAVGQRPERLAINFALAGSYIAVLFMVVRPALAPLGRAYEARGHLTPGLFAAILILLSASAYAADRIGVHVIVGGFLTGVIMPARTRLFPDMAARLSNVAAVVLLPVFLTFSGLNTDLTRLGSHFLPGVAVLVVAGITGSWLGGAVFARLGGLSWADGNVLGILLNCRGLIVLVIALVALDQGVITPPMQAGAVLMALVTTAMTGPLIDAFLPRVAGGGARPS
jgi:Kef-type K+ transport system membrane component KefB